MAREREARMGARLPARLASGAARPAGPGAPQLRGRRGGLRAAGQLGRRDTAPGAWSRRVCCPRNRRPAPVDWVFCAAMVFQGWGNALHLFSQYWWYDNSVHITLPMSLAPILYIGFARLDVVPDPSERVGSDSELLGMALITMCLGVTGQLLRDLRMGGRPLVRPAPVHRRDRHHHRPRRRLPRRRHRRAVPRRLGDHALHEPPRAVAPSHAAPTTRRRDQRAEASGSTRRPPIAPPRMRTSRPLRRIRLRVGPCTRGPRDRACDPGPRPRGRPPNGTPWRRGVRCA